MQRLIHQSVRRSLPCIALLGVVSMASISLAQQAISALHLEAEDAQARVWLTRSEQIAPRNWKFIVLHHTATTGGNVSAIDAEHRQRLDANGVPWRGIGYHFLIGNGRGMRDGEVQATFRWREQLAGAHAGVPEFNELGLGVCLVGNFEESPPTPAQLAAARALLQQLQREFSLSDDQIVRHGDLKATACPGKLISKDMLTTSPQPKPLAGK